MIPRTLAALLAGGCLAAAITACTAAPPAAAPPAAESTAGTFVSEVQPSLPGWSDAELTALGAQACSAPGSSSSRVTSLRAARDVLDHQQAAAVVDAAERYICPA